MDYAPSIVKGGAKDAFDLVYEPLKFEFDANEALLMASREKFFELIDALKKDKKIKSTLELTLQTTSGEILALDTEEVADLYMVSGVENFESGEGLCEFEVEGEKFKIALASAHKCPRCWKFNTPAQDELCGRCAEVLR